MKNLFVVFICFFLCISSQAQNTNISGIINSYDSVGTVSGNDVTIPSSAGYTVGDRVLLIQMQGASIDTTNTSAFGTITSLGDAGNYEFTTVCGIPNATTVSLNAIQRSYDVNYNVQLIRVPQYVDATITGTLTAAPWDGNTGGVLAFECSGSLTMNGDIDVQGLGFRGGLVTTSFYGCSWAISVTDYRCPLSTGLGAMKGEGIAPYIVGQMGCRGAPANAGGGGNDHNSGGGGGSNAGIGGQGGERIKRTAFTCGSVTPGLGGKALSYTNPENKIYMGGGGGAGHENNANTATAGANGGGIVLITANTINGGSQTINADADSVVANSIDGAGGGGGGGTVLLNAVNFTGSLTVNANGGNGGDVANVGTSNCNGPGGGGGGGILWVNQGSIPAGITFNAAGGINGITVTTSQTNCTLYGNNNAAQGNNGLTVTNLVIQETSCNTTPIPVMTSICSGDSVFLEGNWQTTPGIYNDTFPGPCCDTIYTTTLSVLNNHFTAVSNTICQGDSLFVENDWQTTPGVYYDTLQNASGCDSVFETTLTVDPTFTTNVGLALCDNDSVFLGGAWQTSPGTYTDTLQSINTCDSIVATTVVFNPITTTLSSQTICDNDSIFLAGDWQNTAGTYFDTLQSVSSCDSIIETTLIVDATYSGTTTETICDNDSIFLEGAWQTQAGTYVDVYQMGTTGTGCDSTITTILSVAPTSSTITSTTITAPDSIFLGGAWQTTTGTYIDSFLSVEGCDSVIITNLDVITGLNERSSGPSQVSVYPNPFSNSTTIDFSPLSTAPATLELYNTIGQLARFQQVARGGKAILKRKQLPPGVYYFVISVDELKVSGKLVIE